MIEISENLVWIDCEMTGLNIEVDCLVEVAVVITNSELEVLDAGIEVVIKPTPEGLANMSDFVREMHTKSGLIDQFETGLELAEAEAVLLEYIQRFVPDARTAPLAGNSIGTDRMFLNRHMPTLDQHHTIATSMCHRSRSSAAGGSHGFISTCLRRPATTERWRIFSSQLKSCVITAKLFLLSSPDQAAMRPRPPQRSSKTLKTNRLGAFQALFAKPAT